MKLKYLRVDQISKITITILFSLISFCANAIIAGISENSDPNIKAASLLIYGSNHSVCSATLIGPNSFLTAGNCLGESNFQEAIIGNKSYKIVCNRTPPGTTIEEVALCSTDDPLLNAKPITISSIVPKLTDQIVIAGFGCSTIGGIDRDVGKFQYGTSLITSYGNSQIISNGNNKTPSTPESSFVTTVGGAAACLGDSGGGGFLFVNNIPLLAGIIVRTDLQKTTWLVTIGSSSILNWIRETGNSQKVTICGLTGDVDSCSKTYASNFTDVLVIDMRQSLQKNSSPPSAPSFFTTIRATAKSGETIIDVYRRICGQKAVDILMNSNVLTDVSGKSVEQSSSEGELVTLPICALTASSESTEKSVKTVTVQGGDSTWRLWQKTRKSSDTTLSASDFTRQVGLLNGINPKAISPGQIKIPVQSLQDGIDATLLPGGEAILSLASTDPNAECDMGNNQNNYPYDLGALLDVLRLNRQGNRNPTIATILIADSGLQVLGKGSFPQELFERGSSNWEDFVENVKPKVIDPIAKSHGTEVASVALGGPQFAFALSYAALQPRIRLSVESIYRQYDHLAKYDLHMFDDLINKAQQSPGTIINLSLRSSERIPEIPTEMNNNNSSLLFIVAAGNQGKELDSDGAPKETAYPALYGGSDRSRLITVAALDGKGQLAKFSNWSNQKVDIAAPGCGVPVLTTKNDDSQLLTDTKSGTSLSAPLVSFAAALVRSETNRASVDLKRRILVSSDLDFGSLAQKIIDGRRLNILKAVAVTVDVLDISGKIHFGKMDFVQDGQTLTSNQKISLNCNERNSSLILKTTSMLKFARFGGTSDKPTFMVYYKKAGDENSNMLFDRAICEAPTDWSLKFKDAGSTAEPETIPFENLTDYIQRMM